MDVIRFPRAVYLNGVYAEAANESELSALEAQGYADWSIDSVRDVAEMQQTVVETQQDAPKKRGRPAKVTQ